MAPKSKLWSLIEKKRKEFKIRENSKNNLKLGKISACCLACPKSQNRNLTGSADILSLYFWMDMKNLPNVSSIKQRIKPFKHKPRCWRENTAKPNIINATEWWTQTEFCTNKFGKSTRDKSFGRNSGRFFGVSYWSISYTGKPIFFIKKYLKITILILKNTAQTQNIAPRLTRLTWVIHTSVLPSNWNLGKFFVLTV